MRTLPDDKKISELQQAILRGEKELRKVEKEFGKLVDLALKGSLKKATLQRREAQLYKLNKQIETDLAADKQKLASMPDVEEFKKDAERIRLSLQDYFGSEERMKKMSYEEKRELLHWIFPDGEDETGQRYGIYVRKGKSGQLDYYINARLFEGQTSLEETQDSWARRRQTEKSISPKKLVGTEQ